MQVIESKQGALERPGALCSALRGVECRDSAGAQHRTGIFGHHGRFRSRLVTYLHPACGSLAIAAGSRKSPVPALRTRRDGTTFADPRTNAAYWSIKLAVSDSSRMVALTYRF